LEGFEQMSGRRKDAEFTRLFREFVRDRDLTYGNRFSLNDVVVWFGENAILGKKDKDIREQLCKHTTNDKRRIRFPKPADSSQDLFYSTDSPAFTQFELYQPASHDEPLYKDSIIAEIELRHYLAKHSEEIEDGLRLQGEEYSTERRKKIDLLFIDKNGNWLVVELKVSRCYEPVVGQLLWYMGWVKKNRASANQLLRGIVVAPNISEDLKLATSMVPNVDWLERKLPPLQISWPKSK
jgi:hypothetical protein